jgi:hypothetical protein
MCVKRNKMENNAWKGEGVSGQCCSTVATEGSPTVGADVNNEVSSCVPTVTATVTVPWTSFCSLDMQQINCVVYSITTF